MHKGRYTKNKIRLRKGEYQKSDGKYEYRWLDNNGKSHSIYSKSLSDLRAREDSLIKDIQDGIDYSKLDSTINSYYEIWKQIKTGIRETTFATYICYYDRYIKPKFGKTKLRNVTYSSVVIFLKSLATEKGLRYASIRNVELSLSEVLDIAVKDEVLHSNPCKGALKELKREYGRKAKKVRALTLQEQKIFESYLAKPGHYHQYCPVFTVMLWTGMRVGETLGLRWEDIDFDNDEIDVNHLILNYSRGNGLGNANKINPPKTEGSNRIIPMLPKVKEAFKMEKERQELLGIKCRSVVDGYTNFIFIDNKGEVLDYKQLTFQLTVTNAFPRHFS